MKDSTKVRLHLSKQLFESLTREIIKEAKANDGYTVAVKQPKTPKQSKSQATSPEVQKTDKEAMMGEMEMNVAEKKQKVDEFTNTMTADSGAITAIATLLGIGVPLATALVRDLMRAKTPEEKKKVIQKELPGEKGDKLNEFIGTETADSGTIAFIGTLLGIGVPLATALVKDLMRAKTPEEKKKVIQKDLPGTGGVKPDQSKDALKEYEQHYEMVNGQCRRYNDEGEYEVVSSHYCR
jgi:hypothetical protein